MRAHSKLAATTFPCTVAGGLVPVYRGISQGRGQKMADVTSPQIGRSDKLTNTTHKRRLSEKSLAAWSDDSTIQTDVDRLLALGIVADTISRCRDVNATDTYRRETNVRQIYNYSHADYLVSPSGSAIILVV